MLSEFGNITFSQFGTKSKMLWVTMRNVAVEYVHMWTTVGISVGIDPSNLNGLALFEKNTPSLLENPKVEIKNSSFGSLNLQSGCEALISSGYINAQSKPRNALISIENSFLTLKDGEFRRFKSKHAPTILLGKNNAKVRIERTRIDQNRAVFGAIFLRDNCSIYIAETIVTNSRTFEDGFPAFVLWRNVKAEITHSEFHKNVGHFGGTFWVSDNSSIISGYNIFQQNQALQGGVFITHNNSKLTVFNTTFIKNQANSGDLPLIKNFRSNLDVQPILQNLLQKAKRDFNARKDYAAGGVIAASGSEVLLISTSLLRNAAGDYGGALAADTKLHIINCTFSHNLAKTGGAIGLLERPTNIYSSNAVDKSHSDTRGGDSTSLYISESTFEHNRADWNGGVIAGSGYMLIDIHNSTFQFNQASEGGAIYLQIFVTINLYMSSFTQNMAHSNAGAIKLFINITSHIESCKFINTLHTLFKSNHADRLDGVFIGPRCRGITRIHRLPSRPSHPYGRQPHSLIFMSTLYKASSRLPARAVN